MLWKTLFKIGWVSFFLTACGATVHFPDLSFLYPPEPVPTVPALPTAIPSLTPTNLIPTLVPTWTPLSTRELYATSEFELTAVPVFATADQPMNTGPNFYPEGVNPLTGLILADPSRLERRPLAIKITNFPRRVRPQSGLSFADIVYEYYIERGLTRFIAVFYGQDVKKVGPIRSGRFFDEHVVRMYDAIFAFANADKRVMDTWIESDLINRLVVEQTSNCPPLCRDKNNQDYNNLYADTYLLGAYAAKASNNRRFDQSGMRFEMRVPWGGVPGTELFIEYSILDYHYWQYNLETGRYERFQETKDSSSGERYAPHIDRVTGDQISTANLIVIRVEHEYFVNTSTTEIVEINLIGSGQAYVFRDGQVFDTKWRRDSVDGPLGFYRASGSTAFPLKPGNTFIQVIGETSTIEIDGGTLKFDFEIP